MTTKHAFFGWARRNFLVLACLALLAGWATEGLSQAEGLGLDPTLLTEEFFSVNVIVGMPGTVEESNADRTLSDGRLQWSLPLTGGNVDLGKLPF